MAPSGLRLPRWFFAPDSSTSLTYTTYCNYGGQRYSYGLCSRQLKITAVANTGGHEDAGHTGPKPKGHTSRTNGPSDALGLWPFTYYADSTAGDENLRFYFTVYDTNIPEACRGPHVGSPFVFAKRWPGLVRIATTGALTYGTITSKHFDIFYAMPATAVVTQDAADLYREKYPNETVRLTAATLIYGGLQDINNDWRKPHKRHRIGTDVDLNAAPGGGGSKRLRAIRDACRRAGFVRAIIEEPPHVHCSFFVGYTG